MSAANRLSTLRSGGAVTAALLSLLSGCSGVPSTPDGASLVDSLGARFVRGETSFLPPSRPATLEPSAAPTAEPGGRWSTSRKATVTLPSVASGGLVVTDAASGVSIKAELEGATDSRGVSDRGYVVYRRGHESGADVLLRAGEEGAEDYLHWASRPSRESITYRVGLDGVAGLRLVERTLELLDAGGSPRLRMAPPVGLDAQGNEVSPEVEVSGCAHDDSPAPPWGRAVTAPGASSCEVTLRWALAPEAYPLLLDPGWTTTGQMATARAFHTAVTLSTGKVLVAGGAVPDGSAYYKTAELFNPATGTWAATASMANSRSTFGGVSLSDGRVLVVGGSSSSNNGPTAAEVYNPTTGTWAGGGTIAASRWAHSTSLLGTGEVLIAGGRTMSNTLLTAEKYNPTTNSWSAVASMVNQRFNHTATVLSGGTKSGQVLVAGGEFAQPMASVEIYNPTTNTWSAGPPMSIGRSRHKATITSVSGQALVIGGNDTVLQNTATCETYDSSTNKWTAAPSMASVRIGHTATKLSNGQVLVAGGGSSSAQVAMTEQTNGSSGWLSAGNLAVTRGSHAAALLLDGRVLLAGGAQSVTALKSAEIFALGVNGEACSLAGQCSSLKCASGVCCDTACTAANTSCVQSMTGKPSGTCATIANGSPCSSGSTCGSGFCVDGFCCESACNAPLACSQAKTGKANGVCSTLVNGQPCAADSTCTSGFCTDGFCCDARCNGICEACSKAQNSKANGACTFIPSGVDPANECDALGAGSCALPGYCDGAGNCKNSAGTTCTTPTCQPDGVTLTLVSKCDTSGNCTAPSPNNISCAPYKCVDGSCGKTCTVDTDCVTGTHCINGACGSGKGNGASCAQNAECSSKYCVDGICCNSACTAGCFSCKGVDTGDTDGACLPAMAGSDPGGDCADSGKICGADGMCDGKGACNGNVKAGVGCGASTCAGLGVSALLCDGNGQCSTVISPPCPGGYVCESGQCLTSCVDDTHCAPASYCAGGNCTPKQDNGAPCSLPGQCASAQCVEGLCCDSACSSPCQSCVGLNTQSGVNGKCDNVKEGTDPKSGCDKDAANTCGADGLCGANGVCRSFAPPSNSCGGGTICVGVASVSGQLCDGSGTCQASGAVPCAGGFVCAAGSCLTTCGGDADCISGHFCLKGACSPLFVAGAACTGDGQCESTHCVDGVCCDTLCDGPCQSCRGVNTVGGVDGVCSHVKAGSDPRSKCLADDQNPCGADGVCAEGGQCRPFALAGTFCGSPVCKGTGISTQTCDGSGTCVANNVSSCPGGHVCQEGVCPASCADDAGCLGAFFCDAGDCVGKLADGATCSKNSQCSTGFCVDGVCCESACEGACKSCSAAVTLGANGKCLDAQEGLNPRGACVASADDPCAADGKCGASGQCRVFAPPSTKCGATACIDALTVGGLLCDGAGTCTAQQGQACADGFRCTSNSCQVTCIDDTACAPGFFCKAPTCVKLQGNGQTCSSAGQCSSGFCVDGVCCDGACEGACKSCLSKFTSAANGICANAVAGSTPRDACTPDESNPCGADGTCGANGQCAKFAPDGAPCGSDGCVAESLVARVCDGFGACKNKTKQSCSPYACDDNAGSCKAQCLTNIDCAAGAECNSSKQECAVSGSTCYDKFTVQSSTGQKTPCDPYSCLNGVCLDSCAISAECTSGHSCVAGACVVTSDGGGGGGAAGASAGGASAAGGGGESAAGSSAGGASPGGAPGASGGASAAGEGQGGSMASPGGAEGAGAQGGSPAVAPGATAVTSERGGCSVPRGGGSSSPGAPVFSLWAIAAWAAARRRNRQQHPR